MPCYFCNGYYGPSNEEPACALCHALLFPDIVETSQVNVLFQTQQEIDDGDSGNDEPTDSFYTLEPKEQISESVASSTAMATSSRNDIDISSSAIQPLPTLEQQLELISNPAKHNYDKTHTDNLNTSHIICLPPEVMLTVFSFLDELALWSVGNVCRLWRKLVRLVVSDVTWMKFVNRRWPFYFSSSPMSDWFEVYSSLMKSVNCFSCVHQMSMKKVLPQEETSWRQNRLRNELKLMRTDPPEGIQAVPLDIMCIHWQAVIQGPCGSPYEGGIFYLYIQVPFTYPMCPPIVRFITKIYHPNISRHGDIGIDSINHNWSLALTITKVLISVQSLLTDPYCEISMEPEIAKLYLTDRKAFENQARHWTWKYAIHDFKISSREL